MNCNKGQLSYVNDLPKFNKLLIDSTKVIKDVYFPNDVVAAVHWETSKEFVKQDASTNIFIAAFTTAWARMKLYGEMDKLKEAVLYHDTDSIIFFQTTSYNPPLGNLLGEFTDELNGDVITFVSGGPKNYAFETSSGKTCCKIRGFTLNFRNSRKLNFLSMKDIILNRGVSSISLDNPAKICRDRKRRKVLNKPESKLYQMVYDKRVIQDDLTTLPYGY
ncbi:uncharacterized protein LOC129230067 [Uloborus diversus]|uniref:uncharacterized protein LOC129230067 n=1 Tax=Uloborus diversus TaxID=327109 RepID=UPI00240950F0|nr:uncharacterized protein LOC129230067 [Uloborus diversus]